jgi:DNA-nicking Smr family endonuclease
VNSRVSQRRKSGVPDEELALFRDAVRGTTPLKRPARALPGAPLPPPLPVQSLLDGHATFATETGEEAEFRRDGISREVLRKLKRGHWGVQDCVDFHGLNREQARVLLAEFVGGCAKRGLRCVRIVHGKGLGSPRREPVLKTMVRGWLAARDDVLAFCEAPTNQGGSGALLVLLKAA